MAARNEFDTDLDDAEQGASGPNIQINQAEFETPIGSALRQPCFCLPLSVNLTTARLCCVSSSLLQAAQGGTHQFSDGNDRQQEHQQQQQQPPLSRQHSKFVWAMDLPDDEMLDIEVSLKKEDYGELGSSDYQKNRAMATAPLMEKCGVSRHKILTEAKEGDQSKYSHDRL